MRRMNPGFTLVEIMIATMILGLLAMIALPAFLKSRTSTQRTGCLNNLRQIDSAKDQYALEYGGGEACSITVANVSMYIKDMSRCYCPAALSGVRTFTNSYEINLLGSNPGCTIDASNHTLTRGA